MLEKMGLKLGQGIGKNNQGILNPIETVAVVDKGGLGYSKADKPEPKKRKDDIDMDIHNKEVQQEEANARKQQRQKLDDEERAFIELLNERKRLAGMGSSRAGLKTSFAEM